MKCGHVRARFIVETVSSLRESLKAIGSQLLITNESPEVFIPRLISEEGKTTIAFQEEVCSEEREVE